MLTYVPLFPHNSSFNWFNSILHPQGIFCAHLLVCECIFELHIHTLLYILLPNLLCVCWSSSSSSECIDSRVKDPFVPSTIPSCVYIGTADGGHFDGDQTFTLICKVRPRFVGSYSLVCEACECWWFCWWMYWCSVFMAVDAVQHIATIEEIKTPWSRCFWCRHPALGKCEGQECWQINSNGEF